MMAPGSPILEFDGTPCGTFITRKNDTLATIQIAANIMFIFV